MSLTEVGPERRRGQLRGTRGSIVGAASLAMLALAACGGGSPSGPSPVPTPTPTPAVSDAVSLTSIVPAAGTRIAAGERVTLTATVAYTLASAPSGRIYLVLQDQLDAGLQDPGNPRTQPSVAVTRGSGTTTLTESIVVPATGVTTLKLYFPLFPDGVQGTAIAFITFAVG